MKNLRFALGILVGVALFWGVTAALAQTGELPGQLRPAVIDIQQSVPVLAEIDGATVPFTVDVALRIDLSGPVTASVEAAPTPVVEAATATPRPASGDIEDSFDQIVLDGVRWRLIDVIDKGQTFDYMGEMSPSSYESTQARFVVLQFDVLNDGVTPVDLGGFGYEYSDNAMLLVDERGRQFDLYSMDYTPDGACRGVELNPGISAQCWVVFELPEDAKALHVEFVGDRANQTIGISPEGEIVPTTPAPASGTAPSYTELLRNTEQFVGTTIRFEGEVLEVQENRLGYIEYMRIDMEGTGDLFGSWIAVWYVGSDRFVMGDWVEVEGVVSGRLTYEALLGNQVTIPEVESTRVTLLHE